MIAHFADTHLKARNVVSVNNYMQKRTIKTRDEARQYAIDWQVWQATRELSYGELAEWQGVFTELAKKYHLVRELKENGII